MLVLKFNNVSKMGPMLTNVNRVQFIPQKCHEDMQTLFALPALFEENPSVTGRHRACNRDR